MVQEATGLDIYSDKYLTQGGSKANLLQSFWKQESNYTVFKLLSNIEVYWREVMRVPMNGHVNLYNKDYQAALFIIQRLKNEMETHIEAINTSIQDESFIKVKNSISQLIEQNRPDEAIDRLHTYLMMYIRQRLKKYGFIPNANSTLHGLIGQYKNHLRTQGIITLIQAKTRPDKGKTLYWPPPFHRPYSRAPGKHIRKTFVSFFRITSDFSIFVQISSV